MKKIINKNKGFTLIEIFITLSLIFILSLIGLNTYKNYQSSLHLSGSIRNLVSDFRYIQQLSIAEQIQHGIIFYPEEKKYEIKKFGSENFILNTVFLPADIISMNISEEIINNNNTIKYNSYGSVDVTGEISLENKNNRIAIIDVRASGFIRIVN